MSSAHRTKENTVKNTGTYLYSIHELFFVGDILQAPGLIGLSDPYVGYLAEEIQERMEAARQSLLERGLLKVTGEDVEVDPDLGKVVQIMSTSPKVLVAARDQTPLLVHISGDGLVKQETVSDDLVSISDLSGWEEVKRDLVHFLSLSDTSAAPGPTFTTNASVIDQARELVQAEGQDDALSSCKQLLVEKGIPPESAEALVATLSGEHATGSLVIFNRDERKLSPQGGFAWLTGELGIWKVDLPPSEDSDIMKWTPTTGALLSEKIQTMISGI